MEPWIFRRVPAHPLVLPVTRLAKDNQQRRFHFTHRCICYTAGKNYPAPRRNGSLIWSKFHSTWGSRDLCIICDSSYFLENVKALKSAMIIKSNWSIDVYLCTICIVLSRAEHQKLRGFCKFQDWQHTRAALEVRATRILLSVRIIERRIVDCSVDIVLLWDSSQSYLEKVVALAQR